MRRASDGTPGQIFEGYMSSRGMTKIIVVVPVSDGDHSVLVRPRGSWMPTSERRFDKTVTADEPAPHHEEAKSRGSEPVSPVRRLGVLCMPHHTKTGCLMHSSIGAKTIRVLANCQFERDQFERLGDQPENETDGQGVRGLERVLAQIVAPQSPGTVRRAAGPAYFAQLVACNLSSVYLSKSQFC